jgi:beta-phosphoglucomutase-like phosphatase (HAD superfamily)
MINKMAAVAFDLDGTLIDSMEVHYEAYRTVLSAHGVELSRSRFYAVIGGTASEVIPRLMGRDVPQDRLSMVHQEKLKATRRIMESMSPRLLRTSCLLPLLVHRIPLALVTSGSESGTSLVLDTLGWTDHFEAIVTGNDVTRGKPDPQPYLFAAQGLGVDPTLVLAFEDTDAGVASARNAAMQVIDVRDSLQEPLDEP